MANLKVLNYDSTAQEYLTHVPGAVEVIRQDTYDTLTYAQTGQSELLFFQTPKGQGGKTIQETNLEAAGQFPAGKSFLVEVIELLVLPELSPGLSAGDANVNEFANTVYEILRAGSLELFISSKAYLNSAPLMKFPSSVGMHLEAAVSTTVTTTSMQQVFAQGSGEPYDLSPSPLMIIPNTNFNVSLKWPTLIPLPTGVTAKIVCTLRGVQYRFVQ